ncbi:PrsW family intramembrane metalloprotease [uncultured Microbacterium sp.]|uniref:PrsW family intramembrane metalloprotease n=1 Tax=uncultured Microbacterium sp. TaxID=191216 RepID=UPI0035CAD898
MTFPSPLSQPRPGAGAPIIAAAPSPAPLPVPSRRGRSASVWVIALIVLVLIGLVGYFLTALGPVASLVGMILALIPLAGAVVAVRIIDRWEPEPRSLLVLAVAWGAIVAVGIALAVDLAIAVVFGPVDTAARDVFSSVIQAPLVEEFAKGLGVFVIFATARRAFDGPVDGIVYGALVGAGFAFTENIQYFAISLIEGGVADVSATFFVRGIMSPFAHVMFTSVTGFALGLAARRGASVRGAIGPWIAGMLGAAVLHALWNGSAVLGEFFVLYLSLQVPLFAVFVIGVVALRREEARLTKARLGEYADAGWFTAQEVDMLATGPGRRAALAWARTLPGGRTDAMAGFIADATALASARQRGRTGRDPRSGEDEAVLLARTVAARKALFSAPR